MSQVGIFPNSIIPPGMGVQTLTGDLGGAISPDGLNNINIISNVISLNSGATVLFLGTANTVTLDVTDFNENTIIGRDSGNATLIASGASGNTVLGSESGRVLGDATNNTLLGSSCGSGVTTGDENTFVGSGAGFAVTMGNSNSFFGQAAGDSLISGNNNTFLGVDAGGNYNGAESSNVCIGFGTTGTIGESNVLRIGSGTGVASSQLNKSFIAGIRGITPDAADGIPVYISSTGQLGTVGTAVGATSFPTDIGTATPVAGVLNIIGGDGIEVSGAGNTVTVKSTGIFFTFIDVTTSPYVVLLQDVYLSVNSTGGPIIIQLPDVAISGEPYIIKDRTGTAAVNNITLTTVSGVTLIDGATTFVMDSVYQSISLVGNGTTYEIY